MLFTDLSQYLHQLRFKRTGRAIGYRMTAMEIWTEALNCPKNGITQIFLKDAALPAPFDGAFVRMTSSKGDGDIAYIFVNPDLDKHWKEFAVAKELMHCWSPGSTYVGSADHVKSLVSALTGKAKKYTASVVGDTLAIVAAAEVMLPLFTLERDLSQDIPTSEIANRHNLHPDVAEMMTSIEVLRHRQNGRL